MSKKHRAVVSGNKSTSCLRRTRKFGRSKNALTHGAYASDVVLPGEDRAAFFDLLRSVRKQFCPLSALEDAEVFALAGLQWKKLRVDRFMQLRLMNTELARKLEAGGKHSAGGIHRVLDHNRRAYLEDGEEDRSIAKLMKELLRQRKTADPKDQKMIDACVDILTEIQQMKEESVRRAAANDSDASTALKLIEEAAKIQDLLDSQIDRKIKRIIVLKEYDRMYGQSTPKLIENLREGGS
jgi:hypothetical protein